MNEITADDRKQLLFTRILSIAILIVAPLGYLIVAYSNSNDNFQADESTALIMYLLIPIALFEPLAWLLIKRVQLRLYKRIAEKTSLAKVYLSLMNIKLSLVAAIYIYGLVAFFLTNEIMNMSWFYLIGIVWSVIYWPRKSHFEKVMNEGLEAF